MIFFHMWSNRPGWKVVFEPECFPKVIKKKRLRGRHLSLPLCGTFHEVGHDCCTVHKTFLGLCPHVSGFWRGAIIWKWVMVLCCCMSLTQLPGHTTGLLPDRHNLTYIAAGHCLYPLPSFFPPFPFQCLPSIFFPLSNIKYYLSECELSTGECA